MARDATGTMEQCAVRARGGLVAVAIGLLAASCGGGGNVDRSASSPTTTVADGGQRFKLIAPDGLATILGRERRHLRRAERANATPTSNAPTTTTTTLAPAT